ncbi:MAG: hypothetical protein J5885_01490 [Clostridia bacterium]|nr:hypothetical protein [Clostridia bacterium]
MAKNIFGVRDDADQIDGEAFVVRKTDASLKEKMENFGKDAEAFASEYQPSRRLAILRSLALIFGVVLLIVARAKATEAGVESFGGMFRSYPVPILSSFALWFVALGLIVYERVRLKRARTSETADDLRDRSEEIDAEAYAALGVPADAVSLDLFTSSYQVKNGVEKSSVHTAFAFRAWSADGCLYLSDVENVVSIPLDSIVGFTRVDRRVPFYFWNKEEPPRSETYRPFNIRTTYLGAYTVKNVYIAHIRSDFGEYELLVPPYEMDSFLHLTGKTNIMEKEVEKL